MFSRKKARSITHKINDFFSLLFECLRFLFEAPVLERESLGNESGF